MSDFPFSSNAINLNPSPLQEALILSQKPGVIPFSLGLPSKETFCFENQKVESYGSFLQYRPPLQSIKEHIVSLMKKRGVETDPSEIFLTSGAQQAIYLILKLFCNKDDIVYVDQFTYPGLVQSAQSLGVAFCPIRVDFRSGIDLNHLEDSLKKEKKGKLLYLISDGHNPLGISLSSQKRKDLGFLSDKYNFLILEDDAYGFLSYGKPIPPTCSYSKNVIYVGTFSKIMGPSLRVGWISFTQEIFEKLSMLKESVDINTASFSQGVLSYLLKTLDISDQIKRLSTFYKGKRDVMIECLKQHLPEVAFESPDNGFFIWGKLPNLIDTKQLFTRALQNYQVSFLSGRDFNVCKDGEGSNCIRLSFSYCDESQIERGIIGIRKVFHELMVE